MKQTVQLGIGLLILLMLATGARSEELSAPDAVNELPGYKLIGIIAGDPEHSRAVFEEVKTKQQKLYRIGEAIGGATLVEIKRQQVLLKRGEEVVMIQIAGGSPRERAPGDPIPVPVGIKDPRQALQQVLSQETAPYDARVEKRTVSRPELDRFVEYFQQRLEESPSIVTTSLGPALNLTRVDRDILTSLGLEPTDLIVGISGMGLDSPDRLLQILGILDGVKVFNLSVLRGKVVQPLYYTVRIE